MNRSGRAALLAIGIWLAATPTLAGVLELDFAVDQGRVTFGVASPVLVAGTTTEFTGSAKLVLTGVDAQGMLTAPTASATLSSLNLQVPLVITVHQQPSPQLVGTASFSLQRPATASFDGSSLQFLENALEVQAMGTFVCMGSCAAIPTQVIHQTLLNGVHTNAPLFSLGVPGSARINFGVTLGTTLLARFDVFGREVGRRFSAPEPSCVGMLALGGIALAGLSARRRLRKHLELA